MNKDHADASSDFERVRLCTDRLVLRPWRPQDIESFHAIWGDPQVIWWGANESFEKSREAFNALLVRHAEWPKGVGWFAVTRNSNHAKLDGVTLDDVTLDDAEVLGDVLFQPARFVDGIEIGWHFKQSAWGRGYATEAARRVLDYAQEELGINPVYAIVATQNDRSLSIVEKLGMLRVRAMEYANIPHILFSRLR